MSAVAATDPTPAKPQGRVRAARGAFVVVAVLPWLAAWAGAGFDGLDTYSWGWGIVASAVLMMAVGAGLWSSDRWEQAGTGLVRGALLAVGTYVALLCCVLAVYGD